MNSTKTAFTVAVALLTAGTVYAHGHDGFYGRVEQMPAVGSANQTWVIGGKTFAADQRTHIDSRRGTEIKVGTCIKVDGDIDREGNFFVSEIEQKRDNRCPALAK